MTEAVASGYSSNRFFLVVTVAVAVAMAVTTTHPMAVIMSHSCLVENYAKPATVRTKYSKILKLKSTDNIHNTHYLCMQFGIDGIKAMSRGISGGQVSNKSCQYE